MTNFRTVLEAIMEGEKLSFERSQSVMDLIMDGDLDSAQIGGLLAALRTRRETSTEIAGFASSMRKHATRLKPDDSLRPLVDTCGTGGDEAETINVSTLAAITAAGAGARVAKHGNRSVSSRCGSADLLEILGVKLELGPDAVEACIRASGMGFMFAPAYHGAMKHAIGPRKSLGVRTIFNLLGPLTNPADADRQVLGVFSEEWVEPLAAALRELDVERALVVHGTDGMDEISMSAPTHVAEIDGDSLSTGTLTPDDFGLSSIDLADIRGGNPEHNESVARELLDGEPAPAVETIVSANAGAVLYVAGEADSLEEGADQAREAIHSGAARTTLETLAERSGALG